MGIAVQIENISKEYRLGVINNGRLYRDMQTAWARLRGKEDPWSKIGEEGRRERQGSFWALSDVSFQVTAGQRLAIMGRNGAGKSTLLKILSRITAPTSGTIRMRGRLASLLEVGTGFHPELTGRENVFLNGAILGMKKAEIARKFDEIVAFSEIEKFIDTPTKRYSSGMYVRLAFSVAAHLDAEILIADEVLAVGDAQFQQKSLKKMLDVNQKDGRTILFVSHSTPAVRQVCNSGVILEKGRTLFIDGNIETVISRYSSLIGV